MENTLKVGELIEQLKKVDPNTPVVISGVGVNIYDSWDAPLTFGEATVDVYGETCRINFSAIG